MKTKEELYSARPTSPHLSIYKMQISSMMSIFHRITGVALFGALSIIIWWMNLWIFSKFDQQWLHMLCDCWIFKLAIYATSFAFFYHICTGIRHLIWDCGLGFSVKSIHITGKIAIICACIMTIIFWVFVL